jgi:hypothetical protein
MHFWQAPLAGGPHIRLPRWARVADAAAVVLLLVACSMVNTDGFVVFPFGVRVSVQSAWRVFAWAGVLLLVRHALVPRPSLYRRVVSGVREASRAAGPLPDEVPLPGPRPARAVGYAVALIVGFGLLTALMTYPQARDLYHVSPDLGDPLFSTWRLAWFAHQLPRDPLRLFDGNIFHPEQTTLAYSDAMLLPSLTIAPLVWLGLPQVPAHNLLLLSGFAFSGAGMFLLVRSLTGHTGAALLSAFIFAFLPYRFMHYAHLELQMAQWMPLCLWALHRTIERGRLRDGLLTGLFLACQALSSWYYGIFLATYLVPVALVLLMRADRHRMMRSIRPLAAGVVLAAVLVAPFAAPYFAVRRSVGERPVDEIAFYSATPINYLAAHPRNALMKRTTAKWGGQERELYQGIAVPLIALVGLWPPLSTARIAYGLGFILAFEMSLGLNGVTYPWLHEYVVPYRGLRVPARMAILVGLSLSVLAGFGAARVLRKCRTRWTTGVVFVLMAGLVAVEYRSRLSLKPVWATPPPVYEVLSDQPQSVLLELPLIAPNIAIEPIFMYFSTFHWHRLVNGYSGYSPPSYQRLLRLMATFPDDASMSELYRRQVDFIVVHGVFFRPDDYDRLVNRLERRPELTLVDTSRWRNRETRLYRLVPRGSAAHTDRRQ